MSLIQGAATSAVPLRTKAFLQDIIAREEASGGQDCHQSSASIGSGGLGNAISVHYSSAVHSFTLPLNRCPKQGGNSRAAGSILVRLRGTCRTNRSDSTEPLSVWQMGEGWRWYLCNRIICWEINMRERLPMPSHLCRRDKQHGFVQVTCMPHSARRLVPHKRNRAAGMPWHVQIGSSSVR